MKKYILEKRKGKSSDLSNKFKFKAPEGRYSHYGFDLSKPIKNVKPLPPKNEIPDHHPWDDDSLNNPGPRLPDLAPAIKTAAHKEKNKPPKIKGFKSWLNSKIEDFRTNPHAPKVASKIVNHVLNNRELKRREVVYNSGVDTKVAFSNKVGHSARYHGPKTITTSERLIKYIPFLKKEKQYIVFNPTNKGHEVTQSHPTFDHTYRPPKPRAPRAKKETTTDTKKDEYRW